MWTGDDEMEDVLYLTIMGVCGALFMYLGWLIWIKEKINLIHDYHYKKVKESDKKAYTAVMGKATMRDCLYATFCSGTGDDDICADKV